MLWFRPYLILFLHDRRETGSVTTFAKLGHCVYVLVSDADSNLYAGHSTDLKQRLTAHFNGEVPSTAPRRPLRLVHVEYFLSAADAHRRETYLKTTKGRRTLKLMLPESLAQVREV